MIILNYKLINFFVGCVDDILNDTPIESTLSANDTHTLK